MHFLKNIAVVAGLAVGSVTHALAEVPTLKAAVLKFGTVNWELDTIKSNGFDAQNGFSLDVMGVAGGPAAKVAFQASEVDVIVTDWLWVARQRAEGKDYVFLPYSKAVGSIMVANDSPIQSVQDLQGAKIGIAGGPLDKSWIILQAYAEKMHNIDLKGTTEQVFGAPPLIMKSALGGETDAVINFWHYLAKMQAAGMRPVISVSDAATALGLDPETPLLGYVVRESLVASNPELVSGLAAASRSAKTLLAKSDAAWEPLRGRMKPANDAEFKALIAGFRAGIPASATIDLEAADRLLQVMSNLGGSDLVGSVTSVPEGLFLQPSGS